MNDRAQGNRADGGNSGRRSVWRGAGVHLLYDLLFVLALVVLAPFLAVKIVSSRRYRAGLRQRLGLTRLEEPRADSIWVHGVSVGEIRAAKPLVTGLSQAFPGLPIIVSTTTLGGQEVARRLFPDRYIFYFPLDFGPVVRKFVRVLRPRLILLIELEIWPNLLYAASRAGVPVAIVNGRITERSHRGYRRLGRLLPQMDRIACYLVQNEEYRKRLLDLGVPSERIRITGNLKYDALPAGTSPDRAGSVRAELGLAKDERVLLGGSTHEGEELALWRVFVNVRATHPGLRLVLVPRHIERIPDLLRALAREGAQVERVTSLRAVRRPADRQSVVVLDTLGELADFYGVADVVFVGGSLVPHGGQNMMEPAGLGKPILFGPYVENFRDDVALLLRHGGARQVRSAAHLEEVVRGLLDDPQEASRLGWRARAAVHEARGATERNLEVIRGLIGTGAAASGQAAPAPPNSVVS